jgi:hypothetical protein
MFIDEFLRKLPQWVGKVQPHRDYDLHIKQLKPDDAYKSLANYICKGCRNQKRRSAPTGLLRRGSR